MILRQLFHKLNIPIPEIHAHKNIDLVTCDSRKCRKGSVFVAISGSSLDGHEYIADALRRGPDLVVCEVWSEGFDVDKVIQVKHSRSVYVQLNKILWTGEGIDLKLIAVTGTNGKTSTTHMIQYLLGGKSECGLLGTIRCEGGSVSLESTHTTPDPEVLYPMLRQMYDDGCRYAVLEASSHALDQGRLDGLTFEIAIFTNITQDHLDYHGDMEGYIAAKLKLLQLIRSEGHLLYNNDDLLLRKQGCIQSDRRAVSVGLSDDSDVRISISQSSLDGSDFMFEYAKHGVKCHTSMIGHHNVMNASMAIAASMLLGQDLKTLAERMERFEGVSGRVERIEAGQNLYVYIDYAHTDDGLKNVLSSIKPLVKARLLLLFGCGGDRDKGKRPLMARVAENYADFTVITSDNPRSEPPLQILKEIEAGFSTGFKNYLIQKDRKKAIRTILLHARSEDVVVIAGKGHETYQVIQGEKLAFSDKAECLKILQGL